MKYRKCKEAADGTKAPHQLEVRGPKSAPRFALRHVFDEQLFVDGFMFGFCGSVVFFHQGLGETAFTVLWPAKEIPGIALGGDRDFNLRPVSSNHCFRYEERSGLSAESPVIANDAFSEIEPVLPLFARAMDAQAMSIAATIGAFRGFTTPP